MLNTISSLMWQYLKQFFSFFTRKLGKPPKYSSSTKLEAIEISIFWLLQALHTSSRAAHDQKIVSAKDICIHLKLICKHLPLALSISSGNSWSSSAKKDTTLSAFYKSKYLKIRSRYKEHAWGHNYWCIWRWRESHYCSIDQCRDLLLMTSWWCNSYLSWNKGFAISSWACL